ncbi:hypothetical protein MA22_04745 [Bacillus subtilis]|nr:hypothetical protein MA22_04745 [Bacillus subtilis]APH48906.1 hypothetical protein BSF20_11035 [Bacillus amyloliquefaciens]CCF06516.1 hypothetical protein BACAU_2982 [Bacillus velezensis CAU B946]
MTMNPLSGGKLCVSRIHRGFAASWYLEFFVNTNSRTHQDQKPLLTGRARGFYKISEKGGALPLREP